MALFRYEAYDKNGRVISGVMNADDVSDVTHKLNQKGYSPKMISLAPGSDLVSLLEADAPPKPVKPTVGVNSLAAYFRSLATTVRSGISVQQALAQLSRTAANAKLRRAANQALESINKGFSLSKAMYAQKDIFPSWVSGIVFAGEQGGFLETALADIANLLDEEYRNRVFSWFIRLLWWSSIIAIPFILPMLWMEPIILKLFNEGAATTLDAINLIINGYVQYFIKVGIPTAIGIAALRLTQVQILSRNPELQAFWSNFVLHIPLVGRAEKARSLAIFSALLGRLYDAGVQPEKAWVSACKSVPNYAIASRLYKLRSSISAGKPMQTALAKSGLFDNESISMFASAEQAGSLPQALNQVSARYANEASAGRKSVHFWNTSFGCSFLLIINALIVIFAMKIWLAPVYQLIKEISGGG